jgi:hypothetical protein
MKTVGFLNRYFLKIYLLISNRRGKGIRKRMPAAENQGAACELL